MLAKNQINFFFEDVSFLLKNKKNLKLWIAHASAAEGYSINNLNFVFCSDDFLLKMNKQYLDHDFFTDIITFDTRDSDDLTNKNISGDFFISYERILENASVFKKLISTELHRVMIHGVLHLIGYDDKKVSLKKLMSKKEDFYLACRTFV
jgi:probable rRNA maturation factor